MNKQCNINDGSNVKHILLILNNCFCRSTMLELNYSKYNRMILVFCWRVGAFIYGDHIIGLQFFIVSTLKLNSSYGTVMLCSSS
jgi:hypothetical protein